MLKVIHSVSVMDRAGQETFIMNLFRKIDRDAIQFDFLCSEMREGDYDAEIRSLGGHIFYTEAVTAKGPWKQIQGMRNLRRALREHPCDVFHIHTHHALDAVEETIAAKLAGVKTVVVHSHNTSALYHRTVHKLCKPMLSLLPIKRFACSEAAGRWMFCGDRFRVIHNGLDLDVCHFEPQTRESVRAAMGWEGKHIVGHVGRFNEVKNHRFLIQIFDNIHAMDAKAHLVLVGQGELEAEIRALVEEKRLTDAVSFLGVREDVIKLYQGMDMLLFPSLFEGLSVVLTEAQACDLPCLASDTNSKESILTGRLMMCSLASTPECWAEKASEILSSPCERTDNREQIRAAGYDISQLAAELKDIYTA